MIKMTVEVSSDLLQVINYFRSIVRLKQTQQKYVLVDKKKEKFKWFPVYSLSSDGLCINFYCLVQVLYFFSYPNENTCVEMRHCVNFFIPTHSCIVSVLAFSFDR